MKPYFQTTLGKLYNNDCFEILDNLQSESVDLILTDPPYGISNEMVITRTRNTMKFQATTDLSNNFGDWDKFDDIQSFMNFTFQWVDKADRLLRKGGMFISYFDRDKINFLSYYLQKKGYKSKGYYADCKSNPVPQARKVKWMNGWEIVGLWQKEGGKLTYNYQLGQHKDYGIRSIVGGKERYKHPTQKPISVIRDFVLYWSNENDTVLDPFSGSGTTAVVCEQLNRKWIAIEREQKYCDITKKRFKDIFGLFMGDYKNV